MRAWSLLAVVFLGVALWSGSARASCVGASTVQLLWSYPESGAKDVPTNAVFWALTNVWGAQPVATLSGTPLEALGTGTFSAFRMQPKALEPDKDYVLVLEYTGAAGLPAGAKTRFEIAFRTGAAAAAASKQAPEVIGDSQRVAEPTHNACADVIAAQDCFDTGQNTLLSFEVAKAAETIGWLVISDYQGSSALWPERCGPPTLFVHGPADRECFQLQRIGAGGLLGPAVEHCATRSVVPVGGGAGAGAGVAGRGGAGGAEAAAGSGATGSPPGGQDAEPSEDGCAAMSGKRGAASYWACAWTLAWLVSLRRRRRQKVDGDG